MRGDADASTVDDVLTFARPLPAALRPYVDATMGYHAKDVPPSTHVGLPTPSLVVVIDLEDGLPLSGLGRAEPERFGVCTSGICSLPTTIHQGGTSHGVMLYLSPLGARHLLGLPASELVNQAVELSDLIGAEGARLRERMRAARDPASLDVLHRWLLHQLSERRQESVGLEAWDCIMAGAAHRVSALAQETGWSERHLHHEMRKEIGLPPRTLLSLKRFAATVDDVRAARPLAEVAATYGYADQAHLAREWRRFTGFSPTGWRRHERYAPAD